MQGITENRTAVCRVTDLEIFNYAIDFLPVQGNVMSGFLFELSEAIGLLRRFEPDMGNCALVVTQG